jgi:DNA-binding protein H-NS
MTSYKELIQQREALEKKIAEARMQETAQAIHQVQTLISDFGLTQEDIYPSAKPRAKKTVNKVAPKYRNPATGQTWTGRGKAPVWIQDKDRSVFLIA